MKKKGILGLGVALARGSAHYRAAHAAFFTGFFK